MTKDNTPAIDPRYDPIYQRGFGGSVAAARIRAVETPRPERQTVPQRPEPQRAGTSRSTPVNRDDHVVVPPAPSVADDGLIPGTDELPRAEGSVGARGVMLRGNPWVATLWVAAVLLICAGVFGTWRSQTMWMGVITDVGDAVSLEMMRSLSPLVLLAGILMLGGVLFLHAVSWRGRTQEEPQE